jgi:ribosomal protein S14
VIVTSLDDKLIAVQLTADLNGRDPSEALDDLVREVFAKRYADRCGICGRDLAPDDLVYIDVVSEQSTGEGIFDTWARTYGPVGGCCASERLIQLGKKSAENGGKWRGMRYKNADTGYRWRKTGAIATSCEICGRPVVATVTYRQYIHREHYFCSEHCRWTYYNHARSEQSAKDRVKVCPMCSQTFTAKRKDAKTCSPACRQRMYRHSGAAY